MDFKIVWTEPALDDLRDICSYIATKDLDSSERVGEDILSHIEILEKFPFIGPKYPQGSSGRVREILCRNYRIFYRVGEERKIVEILTIWHGSRGKSSTLA
jgi:plasmid stabilization system protein ParE